MLNDLREVNLMNHINAEYLLYIISLLNNSLSTQPDEVRSGVQR